MTKENVKPTSIGKKTDNRRPDGTFGPGNNANPVGRIPGSKNFTTMVHEALERVASGEGKTAVTYYDLLAKRVLKDMIEAGKGDIIREFWRQRDGAPSQKVELSGGVGTGRKFDREQMRRVAEEVLKASKENK